MRTGPKIRPAAAWLPSPRTGGRPSITVADLGEFGLIAAMQALLPPGDADLLGIGDDAAVLRAPDARVVATIDMLVEGRHFRRDWSSAYDVGCKAAARSLIDVAAMGAAPTALLIGFAAPADLPIAWAKDLTRGMAAECARAGAAVAGGDVSSADSVTLAVTGLGDLAGLDPVTRSGARPGDQLALAGTLGRSAAGLALLEAGLAGDAGRSSAGHAAGDPAAGRSSAGHAAAGRPAAAKSWSGARGTDELGELVAAHRRPRPPYASGPEAARLGATSMIDISDGLVADLGHVAAASGVLITVDAAALPSSPELRSAADALGGADWLSWVLAGGEDHALAATFPAGTALPADWLVIGGVSRGSGVVVDGRLPRDARDFRGWEHFA
jgi:thiamine-monophosphate kinase